MRVPFLDLNREHRELLPTFQKIFTTHLKSGAFVLGNSVSEFEKKFASYLGSGHAVGLNSGTDALWLGLKALGIGPGDEVITTSLSFAGTAEAILFVGATPVFVDVDPATGLMDVAEAEKKITPRAKVLLPVHLYGNAVPMQPLVEIASARNLYVIEDACQSHGTEVEGKKTGTLGILGCFSFYPSKNLGALGDGGAVTTDNATLADTLRKLRNHGHGKTEHEILGYNSRLDALQASFLAAKLEYLDVWNRERLKKSAYYAEQLREIPEVSWVAGGKDQKSNGHQRVVRLPAAKRDRVFQTLNEKGVEARIYYKTPMPLLPPFRAFANGRFPNAEKCAATFLSLPLFPSITEKEINFTVDQLKKALRC